MIIDEIQALPESYKLNRMLHTLNTVYGITIDFNLSEDELLEAVQECENMKRTVIQHNGFNTYNTNQDYTKAALIMEAIKIYLVEIAPKRPRRRRAG